MMVFEVETLEGDSFIRVEHSYMAEVLPRWHSGKESPYQFRRCGLDPWVRKNHRTRKWQSTPVVLPGKSHGQRSLAGYSPRGPKLND